MNDQPAPSAASVQRVDSLTPGYVPGADCTVNRNGDLFMIYEAREFIDAPCVIVKETRSGLFQVALRDNPKRVYSVAKRNITLGT